MFLFFLSECGRESVCGHGHARGNAHQKSLTKKSLTTDLQMSLRQPALDDAAERACSFIFGPAGSPQQANTKIRERERERANLAHGTRFLCNIVGRLARLWFCSLCEVCACMGYTWV